MLLRINCGVSLSASQANSGSLRPRSGAVEQNVTNSATRGSALASDWARRSKRSPPVSSPEVRHLSRTEVCRSGSMLADWRYSSNRERTASALTGCQPGCEAKSPPALATEVAIGINRESAVRQRLMRRLVILVNLELVFHDGALDPPAAGFDIP